MNVSKIGLVVGPLIAAGALYGLLATGGGEMSGTSQPAGAPPARESLQQAEPASAQPAKAEAPQQPSAPVGAGDPVQTSKDIEPVTAAPGGGPLGFGSGLVLPEGLSVVRTFESGIWGGGDGNFFARVHGSAQAQSVPGLGEAPEGTAWVLVDSQLWLLSPTSEPAQFNAVFQFVLEHTKSGATLEPHVDASSHLGAPFVSSAVLAPQQTARGVLAYAVPTEWLKPGSDLWMTIKSGVGKHPSKRAVDPWNSMTRGYVVLTGP